MSISRTLSKSFLVLFITVFVLLSSFRLSSSLLTVWLSFVSYSFFIGFFNTDKNACHDINIESFALSLSLPLSTQLFALFMIGTS